MYNPYSIAFMSKVVSILREETGEKVRVSVSPSDKVGKTLEDVCSYWGLKGNQIFELKDEELSPRMSWSNISLDNEDMLILRPSSCSRSLPEGVWRQRISNEVEMLREKNHAVSVESSDNRFHLDIKLNDVPGPVLIGDMVATSFEHNFSISLSRVYPYAPPIVEWKSPIYHPNIAPPERGGNLSCSYLHRWSFSHGICFLVERIILLLNKPQMDYVLDHRECVEASQRMKMVKKGKI